jgi:hypothetical protein
MKKRRLEEVLDECLSAYLDGRRSIDESLSLYPALRSELEPLLRTAVRLADNLGASAPAPHIVERGREHFLQSADIRRRARELTRDITITRRMANAWGRAQWGLAAGAFVATFLVVAFSASALDSGSPEPAPQAEVILDSRPPAVTDLRQVQELIRVQTAEGGSVSPEMILDLVATTTQLHSEVGDLNSLDGRSQEELQRALGYQYLLLRHVLDTQRADVAPEARRALGITRELAREWGVTLPEVTPTVSASPSASPSATPAGSPTPFPSLVSGTPTGTPLPSLEPTPTLPPLIP